MALSKGLTGVDRILLVATMKPGAGIVNQPPVMHVYEFPRMVSALFVGGPGAAAVALSSDDESEQEGGPAATPLQEVESNTKIAQEQLQELCLVQPSQV